MKMIFPNLIEALTVIYGISRFARGGMLSDDPNHVVAFSELYAINALSDKLENGPVLVFDLQDLGSNPDDHIDMIPDLLDECDFVFHVYDGAIVEPSNKEENALVEAYLLNKSIDLSDLEKDAVICNIYNKSEVMARAIATRAEYVAFFEKNKDRDMPDCKLPDNINALWSLVMPDSIHTPDREKFESVIDRKLQNVQWN